MSWLRSSILFFLILPGFSQHFFENPFTPAEKSDSLGAQLQAYFDDQGLLDKYGARIYTPICEGTKCYAVEIDFYWDFMGRFLYFDTVSGKGLTKLDHIPFSASDYQRLQAILRNPNSILDSYSSEELLEDTRTSAIDGLTGATKKEIRQSVVNGAAYSCHTLWHIAHGSLSERIREASRAQFNADFVTKLVAMEDQEVYHFLINSFSEEEFSLYFSSVEEMILTGKGYFTKQTIEKMPAGSINDSLYQDFFTENFQHLDYFTQVALLEKLEKGSLTADMRKMLLEELDQRDSYRAVLIKDLLGK